MTKLSLIFIISIALAFGQTAQSPSAAETAKKARIEGVVVQEVTKEPLRRVEISLHRSGKNGTRLGGDNAAYSAVTDDGGKFHIDNIEPGEYFLDHTKTGYVNSRAAFGISAHSLKLDTGESLTDLRYSLLPQAIVTGRVVDDEGEPVQGASVMLVHSSYWRGSPRMMPAGQAQTNDRGEYRIINVQPGKYYVQANLQRTATGGGGPPALSATVGAPRTAFVSTYYPSASEMVQAIRIEAQAGLELSGQDITLRKEKVVKVAGKVLDVDGSPAKQVFVMLMAKDEYLAYSNMASVVDEKGNFTVNNIRPGQYTATASKMHSQNPQVAQTTVAVGDADVTKVVIQMVPTLEAKGVIVLEGAEKKNFDFSGFSIYLSPLASSPFGGTETQAKSDGTFTISQLSPGHYNLYVHASEGEGYVQSVQVGGEDVYGKAFDASAFAAGRPRVVVRLDSANVTGKVEIPEERKAYLRSPAVLLVPADPDLRKADKFRKQELDQTDSFEVKNLRPGDYLAFAFEEYDYSAMEDPEVFAAIESKATKVSLARGESKGLTLKLSPWPEQFADRVQ